MADLVKRGFGDVHLALRDEGRHEAIDHRQDERADLVTVDVGVGTDDDLVPAQVVEVEGRHVLFLDRDFDAAAEDLDEVRDDVALEDAVVVRFEAVEDLAADRDDSLEFGVSRLFAGAQSRVALHDEDFAAVDVLRAAVDELLDTVRHVHVAGQGLLEVLAGGLRADAGPHVDEHLVGDLVGFDLVLDEVDFQGLLEELRHGLLDELVGDGLLRLVLIGGLGRERRDDDVETVLDVLEGDLLVGLVVFVVLLEVGVDLGDERGADRLVRRAAVFEPGGVVVVLFHLDLVREADRRVDDDLVIVLVGAVAAGGLGVPELDPGERLFLDGLLQVVRDAVFINVLIGLEAGRGRARLDLVLQDELEAVVDDGLTAQDVLEVLERDVDVREDLEVRFPGDARPGLPAGELFLLQFPGGFALLEFDVVTEAVLVDFRLHPFRGVLRGAETQTVQTERELVEAGARVVVIFAAGVHLAEQEFPVVFFFILVVVHRDAASEVLDLETLVEETGQDDVVAVPFARLVDRV